ncbi:hypothetical protein SAMN05720762_10250 [Fibrobacter sp. UWH4]|nr:hypothetical protein SAMN05720762_10250 [Fibrobacter sp. UWH4]
MLVRWVRFPFLGLLLAFALCLCGMSCDPDLWVDPPKSINLFAVKPTGVDSLEMQVYLGDSLLYRDCSGSLDTSKAVYRDDYDSLNFGAKNELEVRLAFYCNGRAIELPSYGAEVDSVESLSYYFREVNEREKPLNKSFKLERFLSPEDTSCGKFVNFAVLKISGVVD